MSKEEGKEKQVVDIAPPSLVRHLCGRVRETRHVAGRRFQLVLMRSGTFRTGDFRCEIRPEVTASAQAPMLYHIQPPMRGEQPVIFLAKSPIWFQGFVNQEDTGLIASVNARERSRAFRVCSRTLPAGRATAAEHK